MRSNSLKFTFFENAYVHETINASLQFSGLVRHLTQDMFIECHRVPVSLQSKSSVRGTRHTWVEKYMQQPTARVPCTYL